MTQQPFFALEDLRYVNSILDNLNNLPRWSDLVDHGKYTELPKQALNTMIAFFWAKEIENCGVKVDFTLFPKIVLFRCFSKKALCDVNGGIWERLFEINPSIREAFNQQIWHGISRSTSDAFVEHLQFDENCLENRIFKAATKIATKLELREIRPLIDLTDYFKKEAEINASISEFDDLPGFEEMQSDVYMELFRNFSKLRNRVRWALYHKIVKCADLGHLLDSAIFAYLMSLEVNPSDMELATKYFFVGIFHDLPEVWTGDIPSPVKDSIHGLRAATEALENLVMEENVYRFLPSHMAEALRGVMLEDNSNSDYKIFFKKSDNYSAFIECWRNWIGGARDEHYREAIVREYGKKETLPPNFRLLMEELYAQCLRASGNP